MGFLSAVGWIAKAALHPMLFKPLLHILPNRKEHSPNTKISEGLT
jgi:hypothetical protein